MQVTYVVSKDDTPLPDLILPVDLRQTTATTKCYQWTAEQHDVKQAKIMTIRIKSTFHSSENNIEIMCF